MKKGIGGHQSANMRTDEWLTPPEIIKSLGEFDLDPCSPVNRPWDTARNHFNVYDNGLTKEWFGRVWLNPPYGREVGKWLNKLADHGNGIAMIFARTETVFFFEHIWDKADSILFMQGRPHFYTVEGKRARANSGAPIAIVCYGKNNSDAVDSSGLAGKHIFLKPDQETFDFAQFTLDNTRIGELFGVKKLYEEYQHSKTKLII